MNGGYGNYPCRCGDLRLAIRGDEIDDPLHFGAPRGGKAFLISMSAPNAVLKSRTILLIKAFKPTLGSWDAVMSFSVSISAVCISDWW